MTTSRLQLYNIGLRYVKERSLDSLEEDTAARRELDQIWEEGNGGAIRYWLEQGHWNFAMRAIKSDASSDVSSSFGYDHGHQKPSDFVRLNMISADETFNYPLTDYEPEGDYYWTWEDPIYMRFVSDDSDWGGDFSRWPNTFTQYCGAWLGLQLAPRIMKDIDIDKLTDIVRRLRVDARSKDASEEPPRFPPLSGWAQARHGRARFGDRGSRSKLIG